MRSMLAVTSALLCAWLVTTQGEAARTLEVGPLPTGERFELVVYEIDGCAYCERFRKEVVPAYQMSPRALDVPMRFVNFGANSGNVTLTSPVDLVPTIILARDGRETGRITGFTGTSNFFHLVGQMLSRAERSSSCCTR